MTTPDDTGATGVVAGSRAGNGSAAGQHSSALGQHTRDHHDGSPDESGNPVNWRDRVRWGPVWAGVLVVLTVFVVLQLLFFALGLLDLGFDGSQGSGTTRGIVTGVLALIAFFVGGLLAGASTLWRGANDGLLHGVLVWALSVLGILALAVLGGSALLGPLAQLAGHSNAQAPNVDPVQALNTARETAGWTALGLGLAVAAAAAGGTVGSKLWPGKKGTTHAR